MLTVFCSVGATDFLIVAINSACLRHATLGCCLPIVCADCTDRFCLKILVTRLKCYGCTNCLLFHRNSMSVEKYKYIFRAVGTVCWENIGTFNN